MKKILLIIVLFMAVLTVQSQSDFALKPNTPSLVYALPKTNLCFEIEVETVTEKPGIFYLYSQRYLATDKVVMEESQAVKLHAVRMHTRAVPDLNRRFAVEFLPKTSAGYGIVVNEQGILCGVNIPSSSVQPVAEEVNKEYSPKIRKTSSSDLLPLTQEYMMAGSTAKMAEGAAKQIYNIRESRLNLLSGEAEHMPDGQALKLILDELNELEQELTALFTGSVKREIKAYKFELTPDKAVDNEVLFRLSAKRGLIDKDDLSGAPYYISIHPEVLPIDKDDTKSKSETAAIYTVLPATTTISISDGQKTFLERKLEIPQFGNLIPLSESILRVPKVKISIDPQTGRLLSVQK